MARSASSSGLRSATEGEGDEEEEEGLFPGEEEEEAALDVEVMMYLEVDLVVYIFLGFDLTSMRVPAFKSHKQGWVWLVVSSDPHPVGGPNF